MKIRILIISLLFSIAAYGQYPGAYLEINSTTGIYASGDTIKVWATVLPEADKELEFVVENNMITTTSKKLVNLNEGRHLMYTDICKGPVHYVFKIGKPEGKQGTPTTSVVGAIVDYKEFCPGYKAPKDLRKFWDREVEQMRSMPLEARVKPAPQERMDQTGMTCLDIEIPMPEGNPVRAYISYPTEAREESLPIIIYAHGAGVKGKWCKSSVDKTITDARRGNGAIAIDINAHGMLNGQPQEYYDNLEAGELYKYSSREITGHQDFYFRLMYLRLVRALDYLTTLPQWDGKRVLIYGSSQGGAQTAALAGIDSRVTAAMLEVPAFTDVAGRLCGRRGSWPGAYSSKAKEHSDILPYYDGSCLITLTKAKLLFEAGLVDYTCPPGCVSAAYNVATSEDKTIIFFPYRPHTTSKLDKRFAERWKNEVKVEKEKWLNDYLF